MLRFIIVLFLFCSVITGSAQEGYNSRERMSLENCSFNESGVARHNCYADVLRDLFVSEIDAYLEYLELEPLTIFRTLIEIQLNHEGKFQLTTIDTDHEKIEALIRSRVEKLESVLPIQDSNGKSESSSFSMILTSHVTEDGTLVAGLPKQEVGGFEDLVETVEFDIIEQVPIYPGCRNKGNEKLKKCMSTNVQEHILSDFNLNLATSLGLPGGIQRIYVKFKIDALGYVVDVKARASHPELADEAIRVVSTLPQMEPGRHKGKAVGVLYALPIIFMVEESYKEKKARLKKERKAKKKS